MDIPIRSLVAQLVRQAQQVPAALLELYGSHRKVGTSPSSNELFEILQTLFSPSEETIIVVDGFDKAAIDMLKNFARIIETAITRAYKVQLLATSRISSVVEDAIRFGPQDYRQKGLEWHRRFRFTVIPRTVIYNDIRTTIQSLCATSTQLNGTTDLTDDLVAGSKGM